MTARFNIFKDTTPCEPNSQTGIAVSIAQVQSESRLGAPPMMNKRYPNSVVNEANVIRGHDVLGGRKDVD